MASSFVQNPGYLSVPTSIGLMPEALQLTYSTRCAVATAIRVPGLDANPFLACRHGNTQPNALVTLNGSWRLSM